MSDSKFGLLTVLAMTATGLIAVFAMHKLSTDQRDLDAGQPAQPEQVAEGYPSWDDSPHQPSAAGVQSSSGQVAQSVEATYVDPRRGDAGSIPALATSTLAQYEDSFLATEEGLFDMTVSLWSTPEFLEITQDEAHELLALDDTMGMKGPDSMLSIVGPLPDREACRVAFASQSVQDALWDVVHLNVLLVELGEIPADRRPRWARRRVEEAISMRDAAMLDLMELCEKETGIPTWRVWWRMYRRWTG